MIGILVGRSAQSSRTHTSIPTLHSHTHSARLAHRKVGLFCLRRQFRFDDASHVGIGGGAGRRGGLAQGGAGVQRLRPQQLLTRGKWSAMCQSGVRARSGSDKAGALAPLALSDRPRIAGGVPGASQGPADCASSRCNTEAPRDAGAKRRCPRAVWLALASEWVACRDGARCASKPCCPDSHARRCLAQCWTFSNSCCSQMITQN